MLNELRLLERGLAEHGMDTTARHPDLSQLVKGDLIRIRLDVDGAIDELEVLSGKTRPDIWTLRNGKHNGFPGLKTARGLLALDGDARAKHDTAWQVARTWQAKQEEIERLIQCAPADPDLGEWPKPGHRQRIAERLEQLRGLEKDEKTAAVPAVFQRFLKAIDRQPPFLGDVLRELIKRARDDGWPDVIRAALVGAVPFAIDVARKDFPRDAADARQIDTISRALAMSQGEETGNGGSLCALTGRAGRLLAGSFPQPTLPSLGQTYLFSRNADIPALARYGQNGPASFPVSADLVSRFSGALSTVTAAERRGKTWRLLPDEAGGGQDLLIAFVASAMDQPVADLLAADTEDSFGIDEEIDGRLALEQTGQDMIQLWKGIASRSKPGETARILILRTVDPGNRKAVYDRRPSVQELDRAARTWAEAMANAPPWITWPVFIKKKQVVGRPWAQTPLSLIGLSRNLYIRGGREAVKAPGIGGAEALALYLHEGSRKRRAARVLRLLLDRYTGLLTGIAHAFRRGQIRDFDPKANARLDALRAISWLGALLYFLDDHTEAYMDDVGFKLGQLLAAADAVHMGYCAEVRGDDMPLTLVGNSVFAIAGRDPDRALAVLQPRWKPYHAWVTRAGHRRIGTPDKGDVHGWAVIRAGSQARHAMELCRELQPILAQMRAEKRAPDDVFRAGLLLGYIAGLKPEPKSGTSDNQGKDSTP